MHTRGSLICVVLVWLFEISLFVIFAASSGAPTSPFTAPLAFENRFNSRQFIGTKRQLIQGEHVFLNL